MSAPDRVWPAPAISPRPASQRKLAEATGCILEPLWSTETLDRKAAGIDGRRLAGHPSASKQLEPARSAATAPAVLLQRSTLHVRGGCITSAAIQASHCAAHHRTGTRHSNALTIAERPAG